jgi:WD40 repeat protein
MANLPKTSKFRHIYGDLAKNDKTIQDVKNTKSTWDCGNWLAANTKCFAMAWYTGGGGKLAIIRHDQIGKLGNHAPALTGHTAPVIEWQFNPHDELLLATGSDDLSIKLWQLPEDCKLEDDVAESNVTLNGHSKKVGLLDWNHTAANVLASGSLDNTVRLWDVTQGEKAKVDIPDQPYSISWNLDASLIACTSKDKKLNIIDPRAGTITQTVNGHQGAKVSRCCWMKWLDKIVTGGWSRSQERQLMLWDPRNMEKAIHTEDVEGGSGILMFFEDVDIDVLYVAGKGDSTIKAFEITDLLTPPTYPLSDVSTNIPQKGLCMLPKKACNTSACEVARFLKLEEKLVRPISMILPRKESATNFQEDVYHAHGGTFSSNPTLTADEWFGGQTSKPNLASMKPGEEETVKGLSAKDPAALVEAQKRKVEAARAALAAEEAKLAELEAALAAASE